MKQALNQCAVVASSDIRFIHLLLGAGLWARHQQVVRKIQYVDEIDVVNDPLIELNVIFHALAALVLDFLVFLKGEVVFLEQEQLLLVAQADLHLLPHDLLLGDARSQSRHLCVGCDLDY